MGKLDGKAALITGATSGMGRAAAKLFAKEGAKVLVTGRNKNRGREVVQDISQRGHTAIFKEADICSPGANAELVETAMDRFGSLDILIPNAGMLGLGSVTQVEPEIWHRTMDTNINAVFYLLGAAIPVMQESDTGGTVVVTGSIAAHKGFPNHAAYCASKAAAEALVRQAAVDYAPDIRINMVQPGPVETKLYKDSAVAFPNPETILDEVPDSLPMGRIGEPEEIAQMMLFLASDDSAWTTGSVFTIDGGSSATG